MRNEIIDVVRKEDLKHIHKLYKEIFNSKKEFEEFEEDYTNILDSKNNDTKALAYYIDDIPVGTVQININRVIGSSEAVLWDVCVDEKYRRMKIATKLLAKAEEIVKNEYNIDRIWLFSGYHREGAHKLYRSLGYDENRDKGFVKFI